MKVLIGGGTGFVGRYLSSMLRRKGYDIVTVSRSAGAGQITWQDVEKNGLPEKTTAVVSLSGELLMNPLRRWDEQFKDDLRTSRIDKTRILAQAISKADPKPQVFVTASAIGYYKPSATTVYTEDSVGGDFDYLSEMCTDWEAAGRTVESDNVRHVAVRIGIVLGKDGGVFKRMYLPFYLGAGGRVGSGAQWFPWVHVEDVAGIFTHAIENDQLTGILNAVAPEPVTNATFTQQLARAMWRPALFPVPEFAINLAFGKERGSIMLQGHIIEPKRTLESGYKFVYPKLKLAIEQCLK